RLPGDLSHRSGPMIRGVVNARHEATVRLRLRGPGGIESDVDAIIDSGFTASLTLPAAVVAALGVARHTPFSGRLTRRRGVAVEPIAPPPANFGIQNFSSTALAVAVVWGSSLSVRAARHCRMRRSDRRRKY